MLIINRKPTFHTEKWVNQYKKFFNYQNSLVKWNLIFGKSD